jgi:hypothetical protein
MIRTYIYTLAVSGLFLCGPYLSAGDLSKYRKFQLHSDLTTLAKQAGMTPSEAKVIHQRPAIIKELSWRAEPGDSIKGIGFRFLNGELFSMVVEYDRDNTAGLTAQDMIEGISASYGSPVDTSVEITVPSMYGGDETVKVIARWEDASWSFNLVRFKYEPSFALVALSIRLYGEARTAIDEAVRLDRQEAPQRAIESRGRADEEKRLQDEKSRQENKPGFRP